VVIYDEAAQTAHARRTQSGDAVALDNLIGKNIPKAKELEKLYTAWYQRLDIVPWECLIDIAPE